MNRYVKLNLDPNTKEWLDYRKDKIGMSDLGAIMGKDSWTSPLMKYEEKVFDKKRSSNAAMQRGHEEEPRARDWINEKFGTNYQPVVLQSLIYPWLMCSLDGLDLAADHPILEIKTPGKHTLDHAAQGIISEGYQIQCQGQMWFTGLEKVLFVAWDGKMGLRLSIQRNEKLVSEIESSAKAFRSRIINLDPPEPIGMDEHVIIDPSMNVKAERLREIDKVLNQLQVERESICEDLKKACGDHSVNVCNGYRISQFLRKGNIPYSDIEEVKKMNLEKYRKQPTISWRFSNKQ